MTCCTLFAELRGQDTSVNYHESSDCIAQKITCKFFPHKKHLVIENFNPHPPSTKKKKKKKLQPSPSLEIWSNPVPSWEQH